MTKFGTCGKCGYIVALKRVVQIGLERVDSYWLEKVESYWLEKVGPYWEVIDHCCEKESDKK